MTESQILQYFYSLYNSIFIFSPGALIIGKKSDTEIDKINIQR